MNENVLELIARVIEWCEPARDGGPGHPPTKTVRVLATLRRFLREGTPWKGLRATQTSASGSTLRRRLAEALVGFRDGRLGSRYQSCNEGSEQGFAASASVVHELEGAEVERQLVLRDAPMRSQPGT